MTLLNLFIRARDRTRHLLESILGVLLEFTEEGDFKLMSDKQQLEQKKKFVPVDVQVNF